MRLVRVGLFTCMDFSLLPKAAQGLARRALHSVDWGACDRLGSIDYDSIDGMVHECISLAGSKVGSSWMLFLYWQIIRNEAALIERWPFPVVHYDGKSLSRSLCGRLFGSVAIWRIELAIKAIKAKKSDMAMNELALAGEALCFAGTGEGHAEIELKHSDQRRKGAAAKLARDPIQAAKPEAFKLWRDWQLGKSVHKSGAAFHRYVCDQLPTITSTKTVERWCKEWWKKQNVGVGA